MELGTSQLTESPFECDKRHSLFIGSPKTGKTTILVDHVLSDIHNGEAVVFIVPDEKIAYQVLNSVPKSRQKDVLYFSPTLFPFAFNVLDVRESAPLVASTLTNALVKEGITPFREYTFRTYFRYGVQTLFTVGDNLLSLKKLITDRTYRNTILSSISDPFLLDFWNDFDDLSDKDQRLSIESTLSLLYDVLSEPVLRNCIGQKHNRLVFEDQIVIVCLDEATLGTENVRLVHSLILAQLYIEGLHGLETNLYIDRMHLCESAPLRDILASCPNVTAFMSLQYLDQLTRPFQATILGSIGQVIALRCSPTDSRVLEPLYDIEENNSRLHLHQLPPQRAYVAIDGVTTELHIPLRSYPETKERDKIIKRCMSQCTAPVDAVEKRLERFFQ